jgi:Rieske Fe-S protein
MSSINMNSSGSAAGRSAVKTAVKPTTNPQDEWKTADQICQEQGCTPAWLEAMVQFLHLPIKEVEHEQ